MKEEFVDNSTGMIVENGILLSYEGKSRVVVVPKTVNRIGINAFANKDIESVLLPEGLGSIETSAFHNCRGLKSIKIPHGTVQIADSAFAGCVSLGYAVIPESVLIIGDRAFASHSEELVIVAKRDSFAYKYATKRRIKVCEDEGELDELINANNYLNKALFYREVDVFGEKIRVSSSLPVCNEIAEHYREASKLIAKRIFAREHIAGPDFITEVVSDFVVACANRATERGAIASGADVLKSLDKLPVALRDGFLEYQKVLLDVAVYEIDKKYARDRFVNLINDFALGLLKAEIECLAKQSIVHKDAIFGLDRVKALEIATTLLESNTPSEVSIGLSLKLYPNNPELIKHAVRCGRICDGLIDLVGILNINLVGERIYALVDRRDIFGVSDIYSFVRAEMDKIISDRTWEKFTKRGVSPALFAQVDLRGCDYREDAVRIVAEVLERRKVELDKLYNSAIEFYKKARGKKKLTEAILLLRKIEFYGDSKTKIAEIQAKIRKKRKISTICVITSVVLVIVLVVSLLVYSLKQRVKPDFEDRGTYYAVVGYSGFGANCIIPKEYEGKPVTVIAQDAFRECKTLEYVSLPEGLISIDKNAFANCYELEEVVIPDSLTNISEKAFSNCVSLESIFIPSGVARIEYGAFQYCDELERVVISDGVEFIGDSAFSFCTDIERIVIPLSVRSIGNYAFSGCSELTEVVYQGSSSDWSEVTLGEGNELIVGKITFVEEQ